MALQRGEDLRFAHLVLGLRPLLLRLHPFPADREDSPRSFLLPPLSLEPETRPFPLTPCHTFHAAGQAVAQPPQAHQALL